MQKYIIINANSRTLSHDEQWILYEITNRLYFCIDGEAYYTIDDKKYYFKHGYVYLIPSHFSYKPFYNHKIGFTHTYIDFLSTIPFTIDVPLEIDISQSLDLYYLFMSLTDILHKNDFKCKSKIYVSKFVREAFYYIMNILCDKYNLELPIDTRIHTVLKYIQNNYNRDISVSELADLIHLDINYFIKIFKKSVNITPQKYIKNYKLTKSIDLLSKNMKLQDVASAVGYTSVYSYSAAFKKEFKMSPKNFIKKM